MGISRASSGLLVLLVCACGSSGGGPIDARRGDGAIAQPDAALASNGQACVSAATCGSGFCVDGVCCSSACTGTCQSCATAMTGQPAGVCAPSLANSDPDNECSDEGAASCGRTGSCDGEGACARYASGTMCEAVSCTSGVEDLGSSCDGTGSCVSNGTMSCAPYQCNGAACATMCGGDGDCAATSWCNVADGTCLLKAANGSACAAGNQCSSGYCIDGMCCDSACAGVCQACAAAFTGGTDGVCAPAMAGGDPHGDCADAGAASCGTTGVCNGAGTCALYAAGTTCTAASCQGSVSHLADSCDGAGTCSDNGTQDCSPYVCSPTGCPASCTSDMNCVSGSFCNSSFQCVAKRFNGGACSGNNQCTSGFCVDGVCCNSSCSGTCVACTAAKKGAGIDGTCGAIAANIDPDNECAASPASTCGTTGVCNGAAACAMYPSGTVCSAASCSGNVSNLADACNGAGTCVDSGTATCSPYACDGVNGNCFAAPCASPAQCDSGFSCVAGTCQ